MRRVAQMSMLFSLAMAGMTYQPCSWKGIGCTALCKHKQQGFIDLKLRGGSTADIVSPNQNLHETSAHNEKTGDNILRADLKSRTVYQMQLDTCQRAMDVCYESRIRPQLDALEQKIIDGADDQSMGFKPYRNFAEDASKILVSAKPHVESTIQSLQVQLEVIQYVGMGDGNPVSTVDFERMPADFSLVRRMVSETRRELTSATEKAVESLWMQHKALVEDYYFEQFERGFDGLIGGSKQFNSTAKSLSKRLFKECEQQLKKSVPRQKVGLWEYSSDLNKLQQRILASVETRRRLSGLDDLMKYFKDESPKPFSAKWFRHLCIRAGITYFQLCQSAWAYRKARGIPYPRAFTKEWFHAVMVPWRVSPIAAGQSPAAGAAAQSEEAHAGAGKTGGSAGKADGWKEQGHKGERRGEDGLGVDQVIGPGRLGTVPRL